MSLRFLIALPLLALLLASFPANAQLRKSTPADADRLYETGKAEYQAGKFSEAIRDFKAADVLKPSPALSFNIAACYERLTDLRSARAAYVEYLRRSPDADDRAKVEITIAAIDARLAQDQGQSTPLLLPAPEPSVAQVGPETHRHLASLLLLSFGAAGLLAGGGLQIGAWSQAHYPTTTVQTGAAVSGDYSSANALLDGAIVGYAVGGALTVAGAIVYALESRP